VLFAGKGSSTQPAGQRNAVNYWSLYDNKVLRKFRGHTDQVTCISMCPADDTFLTGSMDRSVRLWTAGQAGCLAELKLPSAETVGSPLAAYDSTGLVFAVSACMAGGSAGHYLHLYDSRNYSAGAFAELKVLQSDLQTAIQSHVNVPPDRAKELSTGNWTTMKFNMSGNQILVGADHGMSLLLDGFEGTVQRVLLAGRQQQQQWSTAGNNNNTPVRPAACTFTPDDRTVLLGNDDGSIGCWSVDSGVQVKTLTGHPGPVTAVAANPKYAQIASAGKHVALWTW
jgi:COMPASS component SWD2